MALLCAVANVAWADDVTGTINFGNNGTKINSASVTGEDNSNNTWTITTVGTTSFTQSTNYSQVGKAAEPATSITFTTTLQPSQNITSFSAKFGGFSNTAGTVTLKVGDTTVGTGSLNGTNDVTVTSTTAATGTVLTVTITDIAKGVKCYNISYTYGGNSNQVATPTFNPVGGTYTTKQDVTISCETVGAKIYYTTDGSDPKNSETKSQYSEAISVTKSGTTIKAYAEMDDMDDSNIASATYTIIPENPSITQEGNTITMSAATGCTIYYNTGTNYSNTNDPTNASTPYTGPIEMTESAYFKAIAYDEYGNPSGIKSLDFKYSNVIPHPKNINSNYYVKVTNTSDLENGDAILIVNEVSAVALSTEQNTNNRGEEDIVLNNNAIDGPSENVQKIILVKDGDYYYFYVGKNNDDKDTYLYAASNSSNHLKSTAEPDDNAKASITFSDGSANVKFQGDNTHNLLKYNKSSKLFSCYASGQTDIQIYKEVVKPFVLNISSKATDGNNNYYATISNLGEGNFVVPEGLEVSTITIVNRNINKTQSWAKDGVIPGDKAYYVLAAGIENPSADDLTFTFVPSTNTEEITLQDNWLYPAIAGQEITAPDNENEYLFYKLTLDANNTDGSIGFYFGEDNGGTFSFSNDHKAYLAVPQNGDSNEGLSSIVVGDFTGISDIQTNKEQNNEVYTLSGVRVKGNLPKGIYIVNGKKQIVK